MCVFVCVCVLTHLCEYVLKCTSSVFALLNYRPVYRTWPFLYFGTIYLHHLHYSTCERHRLW